ncbi:type II toxin-antitoxin system VapC family toxin [Acaryochloris marina NIES-2412]|uniref:type II toxin-antitoxin system VapC family toxin n=1 Tax=Acaryochloris marina TaxID=155978 RepID=UPI0040585178
MEDSNSQTSSNIALVVTDGILDEVLNYASTRGTFMRQKALALCSKIIRESTITVVAYTPELRELGFSLYAQRSDKAYSLTDCISMVVMKQMDISTALTHDKHFTQEGFIILFQDQDKMS